MSAAETRDDGDRIACPYGCGGHFGDLWEFDDDTVAECDTCGKPCALVRHVVVEYVAMRIGGRVVTTGTDDVFEGGVPDFKPAAAPAHDLASVGPDDDVGEHHYTLVPSESPDDAVSLDLPSHVAGVLQLRVRDADNRYSYTFLTVEELGRLYGQGQRLLPRRAP